MSGSPHIFICAFTYIAKAKTAVTQYVFDGLSVPSSLGEPLQAELHHYALAPGIGFGIDRWIGNIDSALPQLRTEKIEATVPVGDHTLTS